MENFNLDEFLKDLEELVSIESGSYDIEGVTKIGNVIKEKFASVSNIITARNAEQAKTSAPCVEIFNKDDKSFDVLLLCHMDTVFAHGTLERAPFKIEDGKIYGAGAHDMKASIVMAYHVFKMLLKNNELDKISICLAVNSEEEIGSKNAELWIKSLAERSKYVICCEPARANGAMVKERKGLGRLKIEIHGKAVHAGVNPWDGVSAVNILAHWILELKKLNNYEVGTSLNVGLISGGVGVNTVADYACGQVDIRIEDMKEYDRIMAKIEELKEWTKKEKGSVEITGGITKPVMRATEKSLEFIKMVDEVAAKYNRTLEWVKTGGGSDANFTAAVGVPTLDGFGPAGDGAHTEHEFVITDTIIPQTNLTYDTIMAISKKIYG